MLRFVSKPRSTLAFLHHHLSLSFLSVRLKPVRSGPVRPRTTVASGYTHYSGFSMRSYGRPAAGGEAAFLAQSTLTPEDLDEILKVSTQETLSSLKRATFGSYESDLCCLEA